MLPTPCQQTPTTEWTPELNIRGIGELVTSSGIAIASEEDAEHMGI
jgi:hypothetical protein